MFKVVFLLMGLWVTGVFAAIPPMSDDMREYESTHVIEGYVSTIDTRLKNVRGENSDFQDRIYEAKIRVLRFIKAQGEVEQDADVVTVTYWKPAKRPQGWTGPQGQNGFLEEKARVRLYTRKISEDTYELLTPNGWEALDDLEASTIEL